MFSKIKSLFSSKKKIQIESLESLAVDMHSHLIAGIDDGVKTIDDAITIIKKFSELGYKKIITTPHIMAGGYNNSPENILPGRDLLIQAVYKSGINIKIEAAAEYYLDEFFEKLIKETELLTFGDRHVLFELSYMNRPSNMESAIFELNYSNYKPILAHPERYPFLADSELKNLSKVKELGVYFQINMFSLVGAYGKQSQDIAYKLIDAEMVDFISTDIHNSFQLDLLNRCLENEYLEKLLQSNKLLNKKLLD